MSGYTPVYGFRYPLVGEPIRDTRADLQATAEKLEQVMIAGAITPSATITDLIAAGWFTDTGWITLTTAPGFTANGAPALRKIGKLVKGVAGWANTGMAINSNYTLVTAANGIPAALRPTVNMYLRAGTSGADNDGRFLIGTDGSIALNTGAQLSPYYRLDTCDWYTA